MSPEIIFPLITHYIQHADTPAAGNLFDVGTGKELDTKQREMFHTFVAKGLFLCKRARPDIQMAISVLASRVRAPTTADWKKLMRVMRYLNGTSNFCLTLSADNLHTIKCVGGNEHVRHFRRDPNFGRRSCSCIHTVFMNDIGSRE